MSLPSKSRSGDGTYPRTKLEVGLTGGGGCGPGEAGRGVASLLDRGLRVAVRALVFP
jgi:hypothetical protein